MVWTQNILRKFSESVMALIKVILLSRFRSGSMPKVKDRDLIILGNGPSLSDSIEKGRKFSENKDLMCVNFFPLTDLFVKLKPSLYITAAPEFWIDDVDDIYLKKREQLFNALGEKTKWPLKLFIPFSARKSGSWESHISDNKDIEVVYFNDTGVEGFQSLIFWLFKKNLAMPRPHNVLIPGIFVAINMAYQNIYLWGAENNQFLEMTVDNQNNALISQKHFYDTSDVTAKVMRKLGVGKRRVHEILHKFMLSFNAYHIINTYAIKRKTIILNQTPNSLIDAFKRDTIK